MKLGGQDDFNNTPQPLYEFQVSFHLLLLRINQAKTFLLPVGSRPETGIKLARRFRLNCLSLPVIIMAGPEPCLTGCGIHPSLESRYK